MTDRISNPMISGKRCGCDCTNQTTFAPCEDDGVPRQYNVCCEHCPGGAPSAYALIFGCCAWYPNLIVAPNVTIVWRDCPFVECKWSVRRFLELPIAASSCQQYTFPLVCRDVNPVTGVPDGALSYCALDFPIGGCPAVLNSCAVATGAPCDIDGHRDRYGMPFDTSSGSYSDLMSNPIYGPIWELEVTSPTTAIITGTCWDITGPTGQTIVYECDEWECLGRCTFTVQDGELPDWGSLSYGNPHLTSTKPIQFPKHICVVPAVGNYRTPCDSPSAACECRDAGWSSGIIEYTGPCGLPASWGMPRNPELPGCIDAPSGPCGYFYNEVETSICGDPRTLGFLLWCGGSTPWDLQVYCFNAAGTDCELVCDTTTTEVRYCPDGYEFIWACDSFGECCDCGATVTSDCCPDDPIPATLYATLAAASCSQLNGVVVTLTYVGSGEWSGDFVATAAPLRCGTLTFSFVLTPDCNIYMYIKDAGGSVVWGSTTTPCNTLICPMASEACTNPVPPCQASILPPLCSGNMTATVTP